MNIIIYHVNTFTDKLFSGNPAAVCVLENELPIHTMQNIAEENNLPATVFLTRKSDLFKIRWFTPEYEIQLCGHGTLAAGHVIFNILEPHWDSVNLHHPVAGTLNIKRDDSHIILDFPEHKFEIYRSPIHGFGIKPKEIYEYGKERLMAVFESEEEIRSLSPGIENLKQLEHRGIIVTAMGNTVDFVSRVFYPKKAITEDPVTGTAFCLLVPYWAHMLNKTSFRARQLSKRGGEIKCALSDDRVYLWGKAVLYKTGKILLNTLCQSSLNISTDL